MFKTRLNRDPQIPCIFELSVRYATALRQNNLQIRLLPNNDRRRLHRFRMLSISPRPVFGVNDVKRDCSVVVLRRCLYMYIKSINRYLDDRTYSIPWDRPPGDRIRRRGRQRRTALSLKIRLCFGYAQNVRISREKGYFFFFFMSRRKRIVFPLFGVCCVHTERTVGASGTDKKKKKKLCLDFENPIR